MTNSDYRLWKSSPQDFCLRYRSLLRRIMNKNCFVNHRCEKQKAAWEQAIFERMNSAEITGRLDNFGHRSTYLVFYSAIFKEVVLAKNQEEDEELLSKDFNKLILKYQPMAEIIVAKLSLYHQQPSGAHCDMVQQLLANLLEKKAIISSTYDHRRLFRNYIWKIAENEAKNLLKAEKRNQLFITEPELQPANLPENLNMAVNGIAVSEALEVLNCKILTYLHLRPKLLLCLKVLYDHAIVYADITLLFKHKTPNHFDLSGIESSSFFNQNEESGKLVRFENIQPYLNLADETHTDANSYWRWANNEKNRLINYLNARHNMRFDRETFGLLLDAYFVNFINDIQSGHKIL
jgi:DNA-directed RNA polymerase specialized sigma24 family protein